MGWRRGSSGRGPAYQAKTLSSSSNPSTNKKKKSVDKDSEKLELSCTAGADTLKTVWQFFKGLNIVAL
jgi:hypothetical protein